MSEQPTEIEKKLAEKIGLEIDLAVNGSRSWGRAPMETCVSIGGRVIPIVKEALPELARAAGYSLPKSPYPYHLRQYKDRKRIYIFSQSVQIFFDYILSDDAEIPTDYAYKFPARYCHGIK